MILNLVTILHGTYIVHVVIVDVEKINNKHKNKTIKLYKQIT